MRGINEEMCQIYMDDLLVFSKTEDDHIKHLRSVLTRVREFGLKLSREKSLLGHDQLNFLGHSISREGVKPDTR
ncbi:reverse transcriptase domain-containing protein [Klebsiella pneumoniae]|uniref:reverse transcriptase domain-containing protein n=1 Tax=Klebsiella pneumoniae TaxID=573 RepID=UPI004055561D